jgi:hypothetical protein
MPTPALSSEEARGEKSRGMLSHPRHESCNHVEMLVYRIVPIPGRPSALWEKWTALADSEKWAGEVIRYHFPGHLSFTSSLSPREDL